MRTRSIVVIIALLGIVACGLFAAAATEEEGDKTYDVALSVVWEGNTYAVQSREEFYAEVDRQRELGKIGNVYYMSADFSAEKQVSDLEDLYTRNVDILILQPVNAPALNDIIQKFHDQGTIVLPCVSPLATDAYTLSMMSNDFEFGRVGAEFLVAALGGEGNIIALDGMDGISVAINRWEGALEVFEQYPGIEILAKPFADWDYAKGKAATENLLAAFPEIDGVWSSGGDMTRGAIEAFVEANRELVPMMGEDNNGFLKSWKEVENMPGFQAMGCSMPTYFFADALVLGIDVLEGSVEVGKDVPRDIELEVYQVTSDNLDDFLRPDLSDSFWANTRMDEATLQKIYGNN